MKIETLYWIGNNNEPVDIDNPRGIAIETQDIRIEWDVYYDYGIVFAGGEPVNKPTPSSWEEYLALVERFWQDNPVDLPKSEFIKNDCLGFEASPFVKELQISPPLRAELSKRWGKETTMSLIKEVMHFNIAGVYVWTDDGCTLIYWEQWTNLLIWNEAHNANH